MGKLISIIGNLGSGKTTFTRLLCDKGSFLPYWERPEKRPFHVKFGKDLQRWALANQIDFFLFRCNQEASARESDTTAVFDGGFDQDFHVFTRHIYNKGYLNQDEFDVCTRFYNFARRFLPPPDLIIRITVDIQTLIHRRESRGRTTDSHVFNPQELTDFEILLDEWTAHEMSSPVIHFRFEHDVQSYTDEIGELVLRIKNIRD